MGECTWCGKRDPLISKGVGACADCLRSGVEQAIVAADERHRSGRVRYGLPERPPSDKKGLSCDLCTRSCVIGPGQKGYCGVRVNSGGKLVGGDEDSARLQWNIDPMPTNCVAGWVCPAGTGAGFPRYCNSAGPETGYSNLAVFHQACSFDCLFCQNWSFRRVIGNGDKITPNMLAESVNPRVSCICHFGGDPGPQARFAIMASRMARNLNKDHILRVCWETNGSESPRVFDEMVDLSLESGGCVKVDLKAFDPRVHKALCDTDNRRVFSNFERAARRILERPDVPLLVASTLLVPGYVDADEVGAIAQFIADLDNSIPYALLGFHPDFRMSDLPPTSVTHAREAEAAARAAGLKNVRIGNPHILGEDYETFEVGQLSGD